MYGHHKCKNINLEMKLINIVYQALLEYDKPLYYDWMSNINMDFTEITILIIT